MISKQLIIALIFTSMICYADSEEVKTPKPLHFDIKDLSSNPVASEKIDPWKIIELNENYGGQWVVAGDVDNDGEIEIISARNVTTGSKPDDDVHYTSAISVQNLDGSTIWKWGNPNIGRKKYHHDVACQVYDWNGDGNKEIVIAAEKSLIIFEGKSGRVLKNYPLPETATDCIIACNLTGKSRPMDFILKDRYMQIWAMSSTGEILWKTDKKPCGYCTGHRPLPVDIDGDNRDELFCGFFMLNADGTVRWKIKGCNNKPHRYIHSDSQVIVKEGKRPQDWLFAFTYCVGDGIGLVNGLGEIQKETLGAHYESIDSGKIFPDCGSTQFAVDVDHTAPGEAVVAVFDFELNMLGRLNVDYGRYHALVDWDGDGLDDIVLGDNTSIYNYKGKKICIFNMPDRARLLQIGDLSGDKVKDILAVGKSMDKVYIYKNEKGLPDDACILGTGNNFTLY